MFTIVNDVELSTAHASMSLLMVVLSCCISNVVRFLIAFLFEMTGYFLDNHDTGVNFLQNRFSITPLLKEVQNTLKLSDEEIWTSSIFASVGTIIMRFILGPICDKYGPRIPMGIVLFCSACPTLLTGFVQSSTGLIVVRFFIGMGGSTFVMCQYW